MATCSKSLRESSCQLKPPKLSDVVKKTKTRKPNFKLENNVKITAMFKPLQPKKDQYPEQPERAPPPQNSSMGRKNKSEARKLRKGENCDLFTEKKDTCKLSKLQDSELAPPDTKESEINPDKPFDLPATCQESLIRLEKESVSRKLGGKLMEGNKAD